MAARRFMDAVGRRPPPGRRSARWRAVPVHMTSPTATATHTCTARHARARVRGRPATPPVPRTAATTRFKTPHMALPCAGSPTPRARTTGTIPLGPRQHARTHASACPVMAAMATAMTVGRARPTPTVSLALTVQTAARGRAPPPRRMLTASQHPRRRHRHRRRPHPNHRLRLHPSHHRRRLQRRRPRLCHPSLHASARPTPP